MRLLTFECNGFRCLTDVRFEPGRGINLVRGHNAQGKTSLLEAILYTATSRSHRTHTDTELVGHDGEGFHLQGTVQRQDRDVNMEARWWQGAKRYWVNGVPQTRISDILGKMAVVMFSPEDIILIKGTGSARRRFLDMELSQVSPLYLNALQRYRQALRQRNELLKTPNVDGIQLEVWDEQLIAQGNIIMQERNAFLYRLSEAAAEAYGKLAGNELLQVRYRPDLTGDHSFIEILAKTRIMDIRRQMTTRGPHRDDIEILIAGKPARNFGSQGQQKSAALALKLAELELVRERIGEYPIFMLDEVLSELDEKRARSLVDAVHGDVQWVMTTTDLTRINVFTDACCTRFVIEQGRLRKI